MTILLIFVIVFCFGLIGYKLALFYINRKKFFLSLQIFLNSLELDVSFSKDKLKNLITKNKKNLTSKELNLICDKYLLILDERKVVSADIFEGISILKKDEKDIILSFFLALVGLIHFHNQKKFLYIKAR